ASKLRYLRPQRLHLDAHRTQLLEQHDCRVDSIDSRLDSGPNIVSVEIELGRGCSLDGPHFSGDRRTLDAFRHMRLDFRHLRWIEFAVDPRRKLRLNLLTTTHSSLPSTIGCNRLRNAS